MHVATVVGARPQFIKSAALSRRLVAAGDILESLIHTGQHFDEGMSDVFFEELGIPEPRYALGIRSAHHGAMTGRMLEAIEKILIDLRPDAVIVYGDTNSTLAGALAASKMHIPVIHVEAGLRSFNRRMPEELNRIVTDHVSELLLAPTPTAMTNLRNEGIPEHRMRLVGDVMYDLAISLDAEDATPVLEAYGLVDEAYVLATVHRAENTDDPHRLATIFEALEEVAPSRTVVLPLHPRTRAALDRVGLLERAQRRLMLLEPVGYRAMMALQRRSVVIATDSGGVQKEAYFHRVPCVTLRDETEWTELVDAGWNVLCPPTSVDAVVDAIHHAVGRTGREEVLYGGGQASQAALEAILALVSIAP